ALPRHRRPPLALRHAARAHPL
ncbi:MAG: hypothetical protein AVDCRST_MAG30-1855, partial [uncultured Solirubrobacteraceae bacterium]